MKRRSILIEGSREKSRRVEGVIGGRRGRGRCFALLLLVVSPSITKFYLALTVNFSMNAYKDTSGQTKFLGITLQSFHHNAFSALPFRLGGSVGNRHFRSWCCIIVLLLNSAVL